MSGEHDRQRPGPAEAAREPGRRPYHPPVFHDYGHVKDVTLSNFDNHLNFDGKVHGSRFGQIYLRT